VPEPPTASFIALEDNVCPLSWYFTDTSSPGGGIDDWLWDFGDEEGASEEQNPSYQYTGPGDYYVELAVSGPGGSSAWGQWIHVIPEPGTLAMMAAALLGFAGIAFRKMRK
jgi:PKD repeat protein